MSALQGPPDEVQEKRKRQSISWVGGADLSVSGDLAPDRVSKAPGKLGGSALFRTVFQVNWFDSALELRRRQLVRIGPEWRLRVTSAMTEYLLLAGAAFLAGRSLFWRSNVIEMISGAVAAPVQLKAQNVVGRSLVTSIGVALFHTLDESLPLEFLELQVDHRRGVIAL